MESEKSFFGAQVGKKGGKVLRLGPKIVSKEIFENEIEKRKSELFRRYDFSAQQMQKIRINTTSFWEQLALLDENNFSIEQQKKIVLRNRFLGMDNERSRLAYQKLVAEVKKQETANKIATESDIFFSYINNEVAELMSIFRTHKIEYFPYLKNYLMNLETLRYRIEEMKEVRLTISSNCKILFVSSNERFEKMIEKNRKK